MLDTGTTYRGRGQRFSLYIGSASCTGVDNVRCIHCGEKGTSVVDTRVSDDQVRRRRECPECERRFTTYETAESLNLRVVKRDGEEVDFDEEKVRSGIQNAAKNTSMTEDEIEEIVEDVKDEIRQRRKVEAREIGSHVLDALQERNEVAYIRFASVYESFEDAESFKKEVKELNST